MKQHEPSNKRTSNINEQKYFFFTINKDNIIIKKVKNIIKIHFSKLIFKLLRDMYFEN